MGARVVETTRNASELTTNSFNSYAERKKGADHKVRDLGLSVPRRPNG